MWFFVYAVISVIIIILHYVGVLARNNLQWLVYILAATIIPAIIWLWVMTEEKTSNSSRIQMDLIFFKILRR